MSPTRTGKGPSEKTTAIQNVFVSMSKLESTADNIGMGRHTEIQSPLDEYTAELMCKMNLSQSDLDTLVGLVCLPRSTDFENELNFEYFESWDGTSSLVCVDNTQKQTHKKQAISFYFLYRLYQHLLKLSYLREDVQTNLSLSSSSAIKILAPILRGLDQYECRMAGLKLLWDTLDKKVQDKLDKPFHHVNSTHPLRYRKRC
jgi:hypothetical protein